MACKLKCPKCGLVLKEEGDSGKSADGQYRVYDSVSNSAVDAGASRIVECLACGAAMRIADWDEGTDKDKPLDRVTIAVSMALPSTMPTDAQQPEVCKPAHLCCSCEHSMAAWSSAVSEQGWVGCDWLLREKVSRFPPGLVSAADEVAYGWVASRRYFATAGGNRMFNNQLLLKNVTACLRYKKALGQNA